MRLPAARAKKVNGTRGLNRMAESSGGTGSNVHCDSTSYTPTALGHELPGRSKYPNRGCVMGMECMGIQASQSQGADMTRL